MPRDTYRIVRRGSEAGTRRLASRRAGMRLRRIINSAHNKELP